MGEVPLYRQAGGTRVRQPEKQGGDDPPFVSSCLSTSNVM